MKTDLFKQAMKADSNYLHDLIKKGNLIGYSMVGGAIKKDGNRLAGRSVRNLNRSIISGNSLDRHSSLSKRMGMRAAALNDDILRYNLMDLVKSPSPIVGVKATL